MIEIRSLPSLDAVADLERAYLGTVTAPLDGMWESGLIPAAPHWELCCDGDRAGYFCVDEDRRLLRFHVTEGYHGRARELFSLVLERVEIRAAIVSTVEPAYLSLCLDFQKQVRVHTFLYHDHEGSEAALESSDDGLAFDPVGPRELAAVESFQRGCLDGAAGTWLTDYLERLASRGELFALRRGPELLGTGECRASGTQPPYADLGMIVSRKHRRQGLATRILRLLKAHAYGQGLEPICSTTVENLGARKAIERAGFASRHRMLEITF